MRYAFLKYGNVIEELNEIGTSPQYISQCGPKTFSENYIQLAGDNPTLLISCGSYKRDSVLKLKNVEARLYNQFSGILKLFSVFVLTAKIFYRLLIFRPKLIVCVQNGAALWATFLVCKVMNTPFIHSRQRAISVQGDSWRRKITVNIDNYVVRRSSKVICHGPFTKSQLIAIGVNKSKIIEFDVRFDELLGGVDEESHSHNSRIKGNKKYILFLGRVEESKGVFDLLEAIEPILYSYPDIHLVFVGDGQALDILKERIAQMSINNSISFIGRVPHKEIVNYLSHATALVMPTRHGLEGWPMSALEALAMGVPVIGPNAGPFQFMIKNNVNGLLFDVNSVADLRKKIKCIVTETNLRDELSKGALKWEEKRDNSLNTFGEALRLAHDEVLGSESRLN